MVGYRRIGWHETPPVAEIARHTIELLGFTSDEPPSVILIGEDGHHITLHVIRPETSAEVAQQALQQARVPGAVAPDQVDDLLACLYGLCALLRLHFVQEEENYFTLAVDRPEPHPADGGRVMNVPLISNPYSMSS
jgi:Family of unknown function (DUF5994)